MKINQQISVVLREFSIPENDAIAYLLSIYFKCRPSYTPPLLVQRLNVTNILGINSEKEIQWNIPLFEEETQSKDKWDWVKDWNDQFGYINPKRKGSLKTCIIRMKAFFAENPDVRKEEILGATQMYFKSITNRDYIITSNYFIFKGTGKDRNSTLEVWVERYKDEMSRLPSTTSDITSRMQ